MQGAGSRAAHAAASAPSFRVGRLRLRRRLQPRPLCAGSQVSEGPRHLPVLKPGTWGAGAGGVGGKGCSGEAIGRTPRGMAVRLCSGLAHGSAPLRAARCVADASLMCGEPAAGPALPEAPEMCALRCLLYCEPSSLSAPSCCRSSTRSSTGHPSRTACWRLAGKGRQQHVPLTCERLIDRQPLPKPVGPSAGRCCGMPACMGVTLPGA